MVNHRTVLNKLDQEIIDKIVLDEKKLGPALLRVTPKIEELTKLCEKNNKIDQDLYGKLGVKRGLRDVNGKGVLAGLTNISDIQAKDIVNGEEVPCEGRLYYRGYNIRDLVAGFDGQEYFGYEEIAYLLLFGELPNYEALREFDTILTQRRDLPKSFTRDVIMKATSADMMNNLARSVLMLYTYDSDADNTSLPNVLKQCLNLIAQFPRLVIYGYHAYNYRRLGDNITIYAPRSELSTAENILYMLREDHKYTDLEARILDMALVLHMDHGGGNNSTFTTHVVTSSGTDTYSVVAAALGSLKGPKHGGANIKVANMFADMKNKVKDWEDEDEVGNYLRDLLDKKAFDHQGLIYGMGHAVYSLSDPRADILHNVVKQLAVEKHYEKEYNLYTLVEKLAPAIIGEKRKIYKGVSPNVDFYSGLVYSMLNLPTELYTPIFAIARIVGWSAHRMEELQNQNKIIRPAYTPVQKIRDYVTIQDR